MDRAAALARLPVAHAVALELALAGVDGPTIAERLGIDPASVSSLLIVARAKLDHLLEDDPLSIPSEPDGETRVQGET